VTALNIEEGSHIIFLDKNKQIYIETTLFDANHCIGSVMILFNGYMGTILYTGDFRYSQKWLVDLPELFSKEHRAHKGKDNDEEDEDLEKKEIEPFHIDELIIDSTYCDPIFKFPRRNDAFRAIVEIMEENEGKRFCIAIDTLGKEELLVHLANHYSTKIFVDPQKRKILELAEYYVEYFTEDLSEAGPIEIIKKSQIREKLNEDCIVLIPTGLANAASIEVEKNYYVIGYSLHCNYDELTEFIKKIQPSKLSIHSKNQKNKIPLEKLKKTNLNQFQCLKNMKQNGLAALAAFCEPHKLSENYRGLLDLEILTAIQQALGLDNNAKNKSKKDKGKTSRSKSKKPSKKELKNGKTISSQNEEILAEVEIEEGTLEEEDKVLQEESWKKIYDQDRDRFGGIDLTEEEKEAIEQLEKQPKDYVPFSDTSDHESEFEDIFEDDEDEKNSQNEALFGGEYADKSKEPLKRLYSGMLTLEITLNEDPGNAELNETFSMYTHDQSHKKFHIPKDMSFQDTIPYIDILPLINESISEGHMDLMADRSFVSGWIISERQDPDSLFVKLAEHMRRKNIVRSFKLDERTMIYFMHQSQIGKEVHEKASMVFLIVTNEL